MVVGYSSLKHHKLKRRVELKERKRLEILKNHLGLYQLSIKETYTIFHFYNHVHGNYIIVLIRCYSEIFSNRYILPTLIWYFTEGLIETKRSLRADVDRSTDRPIDRSTDRMTNVTLWRLRAEG